MYYTIVHLGTPTKHAVDVGKKRLVYMHSRRGKLAQKERCVVEREPSVRMCAWNATRRARARARARDTPLRI